MESVKGSPLGRHSDRDSVGFVYLNLIFFTGEKIKTMEKVLSPPAPRERFPEKLNNSFSWPQVDFSPVKKSKR